MARGGSKLSFRLRADLYTQLAQLEVSGLPFDRAMAILDLPPPARERLNAMRAQLAKGIEPALAGERSGVFSKIEARLIRAARNAGSPANIYRRLADFYTDRAIQLASMKSKLMLPAFMLLAALVIPPLPGLIGGSISMSGYIWGIIRPLLLIGAIIVGIRWLMARDDQSSSKSWQQSVPFYGPIFIRRNLRDFFESLSFLLEAGVSMLDALPAALDTVEDGDIRRELAKIRGRVEKGAPFADALRGTAYIHDERVVQFAQTGEASGTLAEMLMRHARFETEAINSFFTQLAAWVPRILYAMIVAYIAYGLLVGGGVTPKMPTE